MADRHVIFTPPNPEDGSRTVLLFTGDRVNPAEPWTPLTTISREGAFSFDDNIPILVRAKIRKDYDAALGAEEKPKN